MPVIFTGESGKQEILQGQPTGRKFLRRSYANTLEEEKLLSKFTGSDIN